MAIIDALAAFIRRNPLTVLLIVVLALAAPALLKGLALFILYFFMGIMLLAVVVLLVFRWRLRAVQREMERQFGEGCGPQEGAGTGGFGSPFSRRRPDREGEVKVHRTSGTPGKRVSSDVGDYVDFEETKDA